MSFELILIIVVALFSLLIVFIELLLIVSAKRIIEKIKSRQKSRQLKQPTRCIDPVIKYCQGCPWGHNVYPEWVETAQDLEGCCFETFCTLGFDKGRPEDEPTAEEIKEMEEWLNEHRSTQLKENGYEEM